MGDPRYLEVAGSTKNPVESFLYWYLLHLGYGAMAHATLMPCTLPYAFCEQWQTVGTLHVPSPGDIVLLAHKDVIAEKTGHKGYHACVCESWGDTEFKSYDYGQWNQMYNVPGGRKNVRKLDKPWVFETHRVMGWVDISRLPITKPAKLPEGLDIGIAVDTEKEFHFYTDKDN